ncbi:MAG: DUF4132 domain-containing protein [Fimbriiglobus sp.]
MPERLFELQSGKAPHFWAITVESSSHTIRSGDVGTTGESKTKSFKTATAANKDAEKLIAKITSQGYTEQIVAKVLPSGERYVDLPPEAWLYNTYRPRPVFPPKPTDDFDLAKCLAKLKEQSRKVDKNPDMVELVYYHDRGPMNKLSLSECKFWLNAYKLLAKPKKWDDLESTLSGIDYTTHYNLTNDELDFIHKSGDESDRGYSYYFLKFASFEQVLYLLSLPISTNFNVYWFDNDHDIAAYLLSEVLPYSSEQEITRLRTAFQKHWPAIDSVSDIKTQLKYIRIAALLGMNREVQNSIEPLIRANEQYLGRSAFEWYAGIMAVYGLSSEEAVISTVREQKLKLDTVSQIRGWLAHTEWRQLNLVTEAIFKASEKYGWFVRELARVKAPETAVEMTKIWAEYVKSTPPKDWLLEHPQYTIPGLLPIAGNNSKLGKAAQDILRQLRRKGYEAALSDAIDALPEASRERLREAILEDEATKYAELTAADMPAELREALAAMPKAKPVAWLDFGALPSIIVGGKRLAEPDAMKVATAVKGLKEAKTPVLFDVLRKHVTPQNLDAFAWGLFEAWQRSGMDSKEKWAFLLMGFLGGNTSALKLTPLIREWPGDGKHQVAVTGLNVLAGIGTDTALMQLNGIAAKVKFAGIKKNAQEMMTKISEARNLTRQELEDRIVPDLGLDARGGRDFDFGPRQFRVVLDPSLNPVVREADGKQRSDLPKPNAKDDTTLATAASTEWKLLKKQLKEVIKLQNDRLEQAMVTMRRWSVEEFEMFHVKHPLMTNFAKRLVWGGFDSQGKLLRCFRVNDESEYTRADDQAMNLDGITKVGIVHPLQLDAAERGAWGQLFGDYEIIPPFPQLGRSTHTLSAEDAKGTTVSQFQGRSVPSVVLWGMMEKRGWDRGSSYDHGGVGEFSKYFVAAGVTVFVQINPGISRGAFDLLGSDQTFERIFFLKGNHNFETYGYHKREEYVTLSTIDSIVLSEVLMDLTQMTSKGT